MSEQTREEHFESKLRKELKAQGATKKTIERHIDTFTLLQQPSLSGSTPEEAFRITLRDFEDCADMRRHRCDHPLSTSAN